MKSKKIVHCKPAGIEGTVLWVLWRSLESLAQNKDVYSKLNIAAVVDAHIIKPGKLTALHNFTGFNCINTVMFFW